ncbi:MAG: ubiquinol-cytochrome c reductase iron-sulfur subunit [Ignavibacteriaceae bacterium]|nr:ubiquinol-cytochrome c reductase iron-sulfur subunit [Ignavibacteriaceae bacterium]
MNAVSRRKFFKSILVLLTVPFTWLAYLNSKQTSENAVSSKITILYDAIPMGISFHDKFIAVKDQTSIKFFSAKCSHLGCTIKNNIGDELICPCHGSRFDIIGNVLNGPAQKPLQQLNFKKNKSEITVYGL